MLNWLMTDTQKYMQIVLHFKSDQLRCALTTFASTSRFHRQEQSSSQPPQQQQHEQQ
jgi:hypothetical protein